MIVFASDVEDIMRLGRPDPGSSLEVPVRVTFQLNYMRNNPLRKKKDLIKIPKYAKLFINPDEPHEMRRNKGIFQVDSFQGQSGWERGNLQHLQRGMDKDRRRDVHSV